MKFSFNKIPHHSSWSWKSIIRGRDIILKGIRKDEGNWLTTNIWDNPLIPSHTKFKLSSPKPNPCTTSLMSNIIDPNSGSWNLSLIQNHISSFEKAKILKIPISSNPNHDSWIWHLDHCGHFTIESVYTLLLVI